MKPTSNPTPQRGQRIPEHFFRLIADFTYDWESWLSADGDVLWVNEAVKRFTGYSAEECLAMRDYPLPLVALEYRKMIARCVDEGRTGSTANNIEFRALHRDGSQRWCAVSWQPMIDATGQSLGFRASVRDITEKRQMREQLRLHNEHLEQLVQERTAKIAELEKHRLKMEKLAAIGELAAGVAHEINNPLAGIRNAFTLIKRQLSEDMKHYDKLDLIDREIERISAITHQMYQLYRPSGQDVTRLSITKLIDEVITLTQPLSSKRKVEVLHSRSGSRQDFRPAPSKLSTSSATELADDEVCLRPDELKQVLLNLVRNAIQASSAGQQVIVSATTGLDHVTMKVRDQGHGIPESVIGNVFDPFFSTKTETIGQGMGLGLSVSLGIVEAMKGTIEVTSKQNFGTEFIVRLPRTLT